MKLQLEPLISALHSFPHDAIRQRLHVRRPLCLQGLLHLLLHLSLSCCFGLCLNLNLHLLQTSHTHTRKHKITSKENKSSWQVHSRALALLPLELLPPLADLLLQTPLHLLLDLLPQLFLQHFRRNRNLQTFSGWGH